MYIKGRLTMNCISADPGSLGQGNPPRQSGDCPEGYVCLSNGNCGGMFYFGKLSNEINYLKTYLKCIANFITIDT